MTVTHSDFDPTVLGQYQEAPQLLHFQFEGPGIQVYRYALVDTIPPAELNPRSKLRAHEAHMTHREIKRGYIK